VRPASLAAAKFWADYLRAGNAPLDNGDKSEVGDVTVFLANMIQATSVQIEPAKADAFEAALAAIIDAKLTKVAEYAAPRVQFGVDYHPDWLLFEAAEAAGVRLTMTSLPWKSFTTVTPDKVIAKVGYGAPTSVVYEREGQGNA
jgi:hypothetical protein